MDNKQSQHIFTTVQNLLQAYLKRAKDLVYLMLLETKLAAKSVINLIILSILFLTLLFSSWLSLLFLLFTFLQSLHLSNVISASIILLVNFVGMLIVVWLMLKSKNNLLFSATLRQLTQRDHFPEERIE